MKIKTSKLTGAVLDWAVAKCEAESITIRNGNVFEADGQFSEGKLYGPSTDWAQAGPIIERENITLIRCDNTYGKDANGFCNNVKIPVWAAEHPGQWIGHSQCSQYEGENYPPQYEITVTDCHHGSTPLIAAMRCFVANKLGLEIEIPNELIKDTPKNLTSALPSKSYVGEIVSVNDADHIVQNIGKNTLIAHTPEKLDRIPAHGEKVTIKYDDKGMGSVIPREKSKSTSLEH